MIRTYFYLRKFKGKAKIYYRLFGENTKNPTSGISTGLSVWPVDWDSKSQKAISGTDKDKINATLARMKNQKESTSPLSGVTQNDLNMENQMTVQPQQMESYGSWKEYVIADLKEKVSELKKRNNELETKSREDDKKLLELEKEVAFKDKEHELDMQGKDMERGNSLGGLVEKVAGNEQLSAVVYVLANRLLGVDSVPSQIEEQQQLGVDPESKQGMMIKTFQSWFLELEEDQQTKIWNLIMVLSNSKNLSEKVDGVINNLKNGVQARYAGQ